MTTTLLTPRLCTGSYPLYPSSLDVQALEGQRNGLEHLMRIIKKDKQDLEVGRLLNWFGVELRTSREYRLSALPFCRDETFFRNVAVVRWYVLLIVAVCLDGGMNDALESG